MGERVVNVEKTIEFILDMQAKAEARADRADERAEERGNRADERANRAEERADRADRRMERLEAAIAQTNRVVKLMVGAGRSLRSDVRDLQRWRVEVRQWQARTDQNLAEITGKLDALTDIVEKWVRRNGRRHG